MTETQICNKLLPLLGSPEAVEVFLTSPQPLLHGQCPETLFASGRAADVAELVDQLRVRLG